jgi:hypothetical protein
VNEAAINLYLSRDLARESGQSAIAESA